VARVVLGLNAGIALCNFLSVEIEDRFSLQEWTLVCWLYDTQRLEGRRA